MRLAQISLVLLLLTGCAGLQGKSRHTAKDDKPKSDLPETVIVTYHVKSGSEAALQKVLERAWKIYQKEGMVNPAPHLIFRDDDTGGTTKFVEIFTWVSHAKPEHAPASVNAVWDEMKGCCESRDGHPALDGGEIHLLTN